MSCEETKNMKLLNGASDWKISPDLKISPQFPVQIIQTEKRPDIVAWSDSKKSVLLIELFVSWEENWEEAHERKKNRYETLDWTITGTTSLGYSGDGNNGNEKVLPSPQSTIRCNIMSYLR